VAWSPDNLRFATASEDQTICVWNRDKEKLATLTGHTTAVTSIDWKNTIIGPVLASCADDRTIRIWKENENGWVNYHTFQTIHIAEWHTVTYLAIEEGGSKLACATQNGYIFLFDLLEKSEIICNRMHQSSVEGLVWKKSYNLLATCSSDCNINVYSCQ